MEENRFIREVRKICYFKKSFLCIRYPRFFFFQIKRGKIDAVAEKQGLSEYLSFITPFLPPSLYVPAFYLNCHEVTSRTSRDTELFSQFPLFFSLMIF